MSFPGVIPPLFSLRAVCRAINCIIGGGGVGGFDAGVLWIDGITGSPPGSVAQSALPVIGSMGNSRKIAGGHQVIEDFAEIAVCPICKLQ